MKIAEDALENEIKTLWIHICEFLCVLGVLCGFHFYDTRSGIYAVVSAG
jgi:hypothetical protein